MRVVAVKCPKCGTPKTTKRKEENLLFHCRSCGTIHTREPEERVVEYQVAPFGRRLRGAPYYMPVWRLKTWVHVRHQRVEGGFLHKLGNLFSGPDPNQGYLDVYVPAPDLDPGTFRHWAKTFTSHPPRFAPARDFGNVPRLPAVVTEGEARNLADFMILTFEAEKPGVLQTIDYTTRVDAASVVFVPFYWDQGRYQVAL